MINIFTDGACTDSRVGGWAAVLFEDGKKQVLKGREEKATNQRMEVTAAIQALVATPDGADVTVHSDSQYLIYTMSRGWKRRANLDLWDALDKLVARRKLHWDWIPGEATPEMLEAHQLANQMAGMGPARAALEPARMIDVGEKPVTRREAAARGEVRMQAATLELIKQGKLTKGDVLAVAQVAGVLASKRTPDLIPLCHPLLIESTQVEFRLDEESSKVEITARVRGAGKTGFEMEALTAVAVSALTIYDMVKAHDPRVTIGEVRLVKKSGGKSGTVELE
ncbi:MAG: cyclic pyranopterin monophosphate synthase MoaC [Chloroflexi bacterium]|nr:cyclic pyranopterin monophosphate synthase MoaC [Chloroflexota bacterium]